MWCVRVPDVGQLATMTRTPTVSYVVLARASRVASSAPCSAAARATSASYAASPGWGSADPNTSVQAEGG